MSFSHPRMLWLALVAVPLIGCFLWWSWHRRLELIAQFVQSRLLAHLTVGVSRKLQKARLILLFAAVAFLFLTIAGPQWGFTWEEATTRGRDILVAIDTSRSMLAEDISPNRLARAKLAAIDLMRLAKHDRLGLIAFAGTAFLQCPLTLDEEAFRQSVNVLDTGIIPQGGTAIGEAIDVALSTFKQDERQNHKILVLFTDGEDHEEGAIDAAKKAAEARMKIFTIGVGTAGGEIIRVRDENGALVYLKDDAGNAVKSRLDEKLLTEIASATDGFYLPLRGADTMDNLYGTGLAPLPTSELSSKMVKRFKERYQWPLGFAIALLIAELFLPDRKAAKRAVAPVAAGPKLATAAAVVFALLTAASVQASPAKALRDYNEGHFKDAANEYSRLLEKRPDDARLHYNAGASAYQAQQYEQALKEFAASIGSPDQKLQQQAYYNLGNTLFRAGERIPDAQQKTQSWEQAVKSYENALQLNPKDADAAFNRGLVKKKLEELKQQQQKDKKDQQKDHKDNQKEDKNDDSKKDQKDQQKQQKQDNKSEEQKNKEKQEQEQENNSADKKDQEQREKQKQEQQQKQNSEDQEKKDKQAAQNKEKEPNKEDAKEAAEEAAAAKQGVMTARQAQQLLDAQRSDEKALIFVPPDKKSAKARTFKDW